MDDSRRALTALGAALGLLAGCSHAEQSPRAPAPGRPSLTVMSYNLNYGLEGDPEAARIVAREAPDLVVLQETTPGWESAFREALGDDYPQIEFHHCCAAGGLGILSKFPITSSELIAPPEHGWFPALRVTLKTPLGALQVLDVHLHPQISDSGSVVSGLLTTAPVRRAEMEKYAAELDPALPTLVVGDFNESRRGAAMALLRGRGFQSALYDFHGSEPTWRWPTSVGTVHAQFDHVAYDARFQPLSARVVDAGRSDHLPVVAVFELRSAPAPACSGAYSSC
jgi:endonuclease/exonuclease/phosphatase family metal-dependent hydrolase